MIILQSASTWLCTVIPTVPGRVQTATASINPFPKQSVCKQVNISVKYNNRKEVKQSGKSMNIHVCTLYTMFILIINPFAPGDFAEKRVLKLVEWFSGHCHAIKS